jgi:hypothetical protein
MVWNGAEREKQLRASFVEQAKRRTCRDPEDGGVAG